MRVDQCGRAFDVFVSLRFVCTCLCVFVSSSLGSQALQHHSLFDRLGRIDPVMELNFCNKAPQRRVLYKVSRRRPNSDLATMCPVCPEVLAELHVMTLDKVFKSEDAGKAQTFRKTSQLTHKADKAPLRPCTFLLRGNTTTSTFHQIVGRGSPKPKQSRARCGASYIA